MGELIVPNNKSFGIKEERHISMISPKTFTQCGMFCSAVKKKVFVKGRGIVEITIETNVYFDCKHIATPQAYGGTCWLGTAACSKCFVVCSEPGCGRMICLSTNCNCGGQREGVMYCSGHLNPGLIGFLGKLFR